MTSALTAPGVYIEELPSGVRTITGVSTSLTAFVGRALCGPVNQPTRIFSFDEFERRFGGLWVKSPMSQAVRHFFLNGGGEALIVRVVNGGTAAERAEKAAAVLPGTTGALLLRATADALALAGFDHLRLTTTATGATTFDLQVEAVDAADTVLASYNAGLDAADTEADLTAALTAARTPPLVALVTSGLTAAPDDGVVVTEPVGASHQITLSQATPSMLLAATAEAAALADFDHLTLTVSGIAGTTFDLLVEAKDADGDVLEDDDGVAYSYTVNLDVAADIAAALDAAETTTDPAITLVALVGAPLAVVPAAGASDTEGASNQVQLAGAGGSMVLEATHEAAALDDFHHLTLTIAPAGGSTFDLEVEAQDADGVTLEERGIPYAYTVRLDVTGDIAAALDAAATPHPTPVQLVQLAGAPMTEVPAAGTADTVPEGGTREALLASSDSLTLEARDEGEWGNHLRASVAAGPDGNTFHLTIEELDRDGNPVAEEVFYNLTLGVADRRSVARVLELESELALVRGAVPGIVPDDTDGDPVLFEDGDDGEEPRITQDVQGSQSAKTGIYALLKADLFNLLCVPLPSWSTAVPGEVALWQNAATLCEERRAFLIIDPPEEWNSFEDASAAAAAFQPRSRNAALYFPRIRVPDPLQEGRLADFPPCGAVTGAIARTDGQRGVWKAPAGTDATLAGVADLDVVLTDPQQGVLNQLGINCLRRFPIFGTVVWGGRTLDGADLLASEWKYIPVRRLALYLEESLYRGSRWAVFEPNDEGLWSQLRLNIGAFMHQLFRQGAFQGTSPRDAYFVKCDADTTIQADIDRGIVNVLVGFAPLKPAEFVIIRIQQLAERAST